MAQERRPGTVYWIDHHVVSTNDVERWANWAVNVVGAQPRVPEGQNLRDMRNCFAYMREPFHLGGFLDKEPLPPVAGLGKDLPRYGFFIRPEDIDEHLRRLDRFQVAHSDPIRTSEEGDEGTAISFEDPDSNQWEFWAPVHMPPGAMEGCGPLKVGCISHGVYGSCDLDRTADLFAQYCALEPAANADIPKGTMVLPLAAGGRIVYKQVQTTDARTRGHRPYVALHSALTVRAEDFFPSYRRMWEALPELEENRQEDLFRPGTVLHPSPAGRKWKALYGRGDDFMDWDGHCLHFVGGIPKGDSMAVYTGRYMDEYIEDYEKTGRLP